MARGSEEPDVAEDEVVVMAAQVDWQAQLTADNLRL